MKQIPDFNPDCVRAYADVFGFPETYVAVDIETTGLSKETDLIVQLGWCTVKTKQAKRNASIIVNHVDGKLPIEVQTLRERLQATKIAMAKKSTGPSFYPWSPELLVEKGKLPKEAADEFVSVCQEYDYIVSHHGMGFDFPMINRFVRDSCGMYLPELSTGKLVDTAIVVKAARANYRPMRGESYAAFINRVNQCHKSVRFSMATCIEILDLKEVGVSTRRTHDAAYDAWLSHLIVERLRQFV